MLKVRDVMTKEVATVPADASLRTAMELLIVRHVSGAPVESGGNVVGVVSMTDLLGFAASQTETPAEASAEAEWREWDSSSLDEDAQPSGVSSAAYFTELWADSEADVPARMNVYERKGSSLLDEHTVDEVMTRTLQAITPGEELTAAAALMKRAGIHRVLVMEGRKLAGIVSASDIVRALAEHRVPAKTYVFNRDRSFEER